MKAFFLPLLLAFAGSLTTLSAQTQVVISVDDVVATGQEDLICVPVRADSFPNIVVTQFSLAWDTTEVTFAEVQLGDNPLGFDDMSTSNPRPDQLRVAFIPANAQGIELASGTVLFEACFTSRNSAGFTQITFGGELRPEFTQEGSFDPFPFDTISGSISYGGTVAATVLPGDTDVNAQVDHRDLLNIGLLHGTTGPARPEATIDFVDQTTLVWPNALNTGVNHAQVDADGNGVIDDADLEAVIANYAMENDGNFEFAPTVASPAGPALNLSFPEMPDAGQPTTMLVSLGDGNDPNAVGYGIAFTLAFDASRVDMSTLAFDFADAVLGDDLLTIATVNDRAVGIVEVALSRKDQVNSTTPGGQLLAVTFNTLPAADDENYDMNVSVSPNAFVRADQTSAPVNSGSTTVTVMGTSAVSTPAWALEADVYPNPASERVYIRNLTTTARLTYVIYSRWGQVLREGTYNGSAIDLRGLPAGNCHIVLSDGVQRWSTTVIYDGK